MRNLAKKLTLFLANFLHAIKLNIGINFNYKSLTQTPQLIPGAACFFTF